jgi:serine protease
VIRSDVKVRWAALPLLATALAGVLGTVRADTGHPRAPVVRAFAASPGLDDPNNARVIVKYRAGASLLKSAPGQPRHAQSLGKRMALPLVDGRVLGERVQALRGRGLNSAALAARLAAQPDVEWAVVDQRRRALQATPNDPFFGANQPLITPVAGQWYLRAPNATTVSATNALGAWAITPGSASVTVAVLDSGVRFDHPDLVGKLHPGYDFVRDSISGDGDGRDGDASDPGDWSSAADSCGQADSSWHGTQVAGLIGAATNNGIGMAGIGRNVMVLPVRVLGTCGGFDSDIIAGMRWAGGITTEPVRNANPARVINMSLGSEGACGAAYRDAIADLAAARVAVVVAAGNDAGHPVNAPANCDGAIVVAGVRHTGSKVGYSNMGPQIALAAPAGNCVNIAAGSACLYPLLTTVNFGLTAPGSNGYSDSFNSSVGTSFAAPLVAGVAGLMLSLDPSLTPSEIKTHLQAGARPFPTSGAEDPTVRNCRPPDRSEQLECYCTATTCGAGMLDAQAAVQRVQQGLQRPAATIALSSTTPTAGQNVSLDGRGSSAAGSRSIVAWQWAVTAGGNLASIVGAANGTTATLATTAAGSVTVSLTVTDSAGLTQSASSVLSVQATGATAPTNPTGNSGSSGNDSGGGAMGAGWLLGLGVAVLALRPRPQRR